MKSGSYFGTIPKLIFEPILSAGLGLVVFQFDANAGQFLIFAGVAAAVDFLMIKDRTTRRLKRIRDAEIEQDFMMEEYDRTYGG